MQATGSLRLPDGAERPVRGRLAIGRGPDNDIALTGKSVSREHALLVFADDRWWVEDRGSANGTFVNEVRVPFGSPHPLRHGDRIRLGREELSFSWPGDLADPNRTDEIEHAEAAATSAPSAPVRLSPFQLQVVRSLCGAWIAGETLDQLPSNEQIAAQLGTPNATDAVKAALRRVYAKAGLSGMPQHAKRRALCRLARTQGWL